MVARGILKSDGGFSFFSSAEAQAQSLFSKEGLEKINQTKSSPPPESKPTEKPPQQQLDPDLLHMKIDDIADSTP